MKAIQQFSADGGYSSGENIKAMEKREIDAYIPGREYQAQQRGKTVDEFHKEHFIYNKDQDYYICPEGEVLTFSHFQKRKNRIYRRRNCVACFFRPLYEQKKRPDRLQTSLWERTSANPQETWFGLWKVGLRQKEAYGRAAFWTYQIINGI